MWRWGEEALRFHELPLRGAFLIEPESFHDIRGSFTRIWCRSEAAAHELNTEWAQVNVSHNHRRGTLRGLHFQYPPHQEVKLVQCIAGAVFDVMVDLRQGSPTFGRWYGAELTAENQRLLYIPKGFAHGYLTLVDNAKVLYQVSQFYQPDHQGGYRYDDPKFGIQWPKVADDFILSDRDRSLPYWSPHDRPLPG
ncbi:MAG: dTDP-4-dehydrorhamnose 3,5-epimerase [Gemmataceae bacterium]|nr:dTDP-4-dehydrorhamnose 3,5-epimerase [Gemmataceae bacterium]